MTITLDDIRDSVDTLKKAIQSLHYDRSDTHERVFAALDDYAEKLSYVNSRISTAYRFIRKGLQAEAIHELETEPNLFDCAEEIDQVDSQFDQWSETIEAVGGYPPAERLQTDLLSELGAAYDTAEQIEHLLRTHRRFAISQQPVERRIGVLRSLIELAPDQSGWSDDLRAYEAAFAKQLKEEVAEKASRRWEDTSAADVSRLKTIYNHLRSSSWETPPDVKSIDYAKKIYHEVRLRAAFRQTVALAETILAAQKSADHTAVLDRRESFEELCVLAAKHDQRLTPGIREVLKLYDRLDDESERQAVEASFRRARAKVMEVLAFPLPRRRDAENYITLLSGALEELLRYSSLWDEGDGGVAVATLSENCRQRISLVHARVRRSNALRTLAVVGLVAIGVAGGAYGWQEKHRLDVVGDVKAVVFDGFAADERLHEAQLAWADFVEQHPWLLNHQLAEKFAEVSTQLGGVGAELVDVGRQNVESASALINEEGSASVSQVSVAGDTGEVIRLKALAEGVLRRAEALLVAAEDSQKRASSILGERATQELASAIASTVELFETVSVRLTEAVASQARKEKAEIVSEIGSLERSYAVNSLDDCHSLRGKLEVLEQFFEGSLATEYSRLAVLEEDIKKMAHYGDLRRRLSKAAAESLGSYWLALQAAESDAQGDDLQEIEAVLRTRDAIDACLSWSQLSSDWPPDDAARGTPSGARAMRDVLRAALAEPQPADKEIVEDLARRIRQLDDRIERAGAAVFLRDFLNSPALGVPSPVMRLDVPVPNKTPDTISFYTTKGFWAKDTWFVDEKRTSKYPQRSFGDIRDISRELEKRRDDAALAESQNELTDKCRRLVDQVLGQQITMDRGVVELVRTISDKQYSDVDSLLRAKMLLAVSTHMAQSLDIFADSTAYDRLHRRLAATVVEGQQWVDPTVRSGRAGDAAERLLRDETVFEDVLGEYQQAAGSLEQPPVAMRPLAFAGWIDASVSPPELVVTEAGRGLGPGRLFRIVSLADGWETERVGELRGDEVVSSLKGLEGIYLGQPFFVRRSQ